MATHMVNLQSLVPNPEELLVLAPSELAFYMLTSLTTLPERDLNLYNLNLRNEFTRNYPPGSKKDIESAVSGSWSWLLGQGYLGQRADAHDASFVMITSHGRKWLAEEQSRRSAGSSDAALSDSAPRQPNLSLNSLGFIENGDIAASHELLLFLGHLVLVGIHPDTDFDFTFSSILTIFLYSDDTLSTWFRDYLNQEGVFQDSILSRSGLDPKVISTFRETLVDESSIRNALSSRPVPAWSQSSKRLIEAASEIAARTLPNREAQISVRHLMGAYIYKHPGHDDQLVQWGLNTEKWGSAFYRWIGDHFSEESLPWLKLHEEIFRRAPTFELPSVSPSSSAASPTNDSQERGNGSVDIDPLSHKVGPSTHVARDKWTIDDALGYFPYAYAIFRFLTDADTVPPLAISIQAPWGGGKTSLMRMIQAQLDPDHPGLKGSTANPPTTFAPSGEATVKQISDVLDDKHWEQPSGAIDVGKSKNRVTVWFNAWKYESTNQIWAGLADAIVKQLADRLSPVERELFFFKLHLKRLDVGKLRKQITEGLLAKVFSVVVRWCWLYAVIPVAAYVVQRLSSIHVHWAILGAATDLLLFAGHFLLSKAKFDETPAKLSFAELVRAPDYDANLGFIHQVTEDLKIALSLVAPSSRPLVIFIDDLDRCSPNKVSDVVEAINLFLAGEFDHCMFVLGIDDEIVAAALNKSHSDVFAQMPSYARATSIGWRFMDKFVQLPFIMPPPSPAEMENYAKSLLVTKEQNGRLSLAARQKVATSVEENQVAKASIDSIVEHIKDELQLDAAQQAELSREARTIAKMDADIKEFSDEEQGITKAIMAGAAKYSRNPRDVKRFVNSFRFYYFLQSARIARGVDVPSLDQLSRWILMSLRWPAIVRWLRSTASLSDDKHTNGLKKLEELAAKSDGDENWAKSAALLIGLNEKEGAWLMDQDMLPFFRAEAQFECESLSSSIGKGLW